MEIIGGGDSTDFGNINHSLIKNLNHAETFHYCKLTIKYSRQAFSQDPKRGRPILVQRYIYSKGGGGARENVPLENLRSLR